MSGSSILRNGLLAVVCVLTVLTGACSSKHVTPAPNGAIDGPLKFVTPGGSAPVPAGSVAILASGEQHTGGLGELHNLGSTPVTIVDVRAIDGVPGVKILGALIYTEHQDSADLANYKAFPPVDPMLGAPAAAKGFTIPPSTGGPGYAVVVGYQGTGIARATITGFAVDYMANGKRYTVTNPTTVAVCPPPATGTTCKPEITW